MMDFFGYGGFDDDNGNFNNNQQPQQPQQQPRIKIPAIFVQNAPRRRFYNPKQAALGLDVMIDWPKIRGLILLAKPIPGMVHRGRPEAGSQQFDWQNKLTIAINPDEACEMLYFMDQIEFMVKRYRPDVLINMVNNKQVPSYNLIHTSNFNNMEQKRTLAMFLSVRMSNNIPSYAYNIIGKDLHNNLSITYTLQFKRSLRLRSWLQFIESADLNIYAKVISDYVEYVKQVQERRR